MFYVILRKNIMRDINKIIIHCSDTPFGYSFSASDIDRWHKERGFDCIGYHYVIRLDGFIEVGRPIEQIGAHCYGHNKDSIGICYIGGRDSDGIISDTRTLEQKESLHDLVSYLKVKFPNVSVHGHNEFSSKPCPCFNVSSEKW